MRALLIVALSALTYVTVARAEPQDCEVLLKDNENVVFMNESGKDQDLRTEKFSSSSLIDPINSLSIGRLSIIKKNSQGFCRRSICTGFAVATDSVMTANHCLYVTGSEEKISEENISEENILEEKIIDIDFRYGFTEHGGGRRVSLSPERDESLSITSFDIAVLPVLVRPPSIAPVLSPVTMYLDRNVPGSLEVFLMGHPNGRPLVASADCEIQGYATARHSLDTLSIGVTTCETAQTMSGSPIYLARNGQVTGIHTGRAQFSEHVGAIVSDVERFTTFSVLSGYAGGGGAWSKAISSGRVRVQSAERNLANLPNELESAALPGLFKAPDNDLDFVLTNFRLGQFLDDAVDTYPPYTISYNGSDGWFITYPFSYENLSFAVRQEYGISAQLESVEIRSSELPEKFKDGGPRALGKCIAVFHKIGARMAETLPESAPASCSGPLVNVMPLYAEVPRAVNRGRAEFVSFFKTKLDPLVSDSVPRISNDSHRAFFGCESRGTAWFLMVDLRIAREGKRCEIVLSTQRPIIQAQVN